MATDLETEYLFRKAVLFNEIMKLARTIAEKAQFGETSLATVPAKDMWALQDAIQKLDAVKPTVDREHGLAAILERITNCNHDFGSYLPTEQTPRRCWKCGVLEK